ncbi:hypothetical protein [Hydrogenophaga sp.]
MPKDFDWYSDADKESVVVPSVQAVAVYINPHGDVVIRQQDPMGDEDSVIVIPRSNAKTIAKAITEAAKAPFDPKVNDL